MSKPEHSPLPWHMENYEEWYDVFPEKGGSIAESANFHNAQFIVTACNSYYDNQQAISELVDELWQMVEQPSRSTRYARALIAKHKAKP